MPDRNVAQSELLLNDASEQALFQDWLPLDIFQISSGQYKGVIREQKHNHSLIVHEKQNCAVHKQGIMPDEFCTVSFTTGNSGRVSELNSHEDTVFFIPGGTEFDVHIPADIETTYFRFDQSVFHKHARILNPGFMENERQNVQLFNSKNRRALEWFSHTLLSGDLPGNTYQEYNETFDLFIMEQILSSLYSPNEQPKALASAATARRKAVNLVMNTLEYIKAEVNDQRCPSIVDICTEMQVSERTLQYSFKKALDITPNTYLRYVRLNKARTELRNPADENVTVTEVAMRWNFWHLGNFANIYLQMFNELPSATLSRALCTASGQATPRDLPQKKGKRPDNC
ncbi:MAG: helix-turn-helix domain-containing protein [Oceanospirillales bacterium]|nr:helix-turn-helix domain-containing protein [Oceanospirillales bacterium]MBR9886504.1 helix-turn-helix domain-containing protein [Oceanospirillales bacterium]